MEQKALGGGCKRVGEMGVGCKVWSWVIKRVDKVEGGRGGAGPTHYLRGLKKCWVGAPHLHERSKVGRN